MPKHPGGRPTIFTQDLADKICHELAVGKSMRTVCAPEEMPAMSSVFKWLRENKQFSEQYAHAKEESADAMAEEILDLSDGGLEVVRKGHQKKAGALAQVVKLQVDTRKWIMARMKPKKYGEKLDVTSAGEKLPSPIYGGHSTKTKK